jgi:hypothetical protein
MENTEIAISGGNDLLAMAITKGVDTDMLEKLIALKNAELERQCKAEFARHFAEMQAEFVPVGKGKQANDANGRKLYSYCPLEDILSMAAPIMAKHGFAYRWTEEALANKEKRINCIVSGHGHQETSFVDIPFMEPPTRATNAVQMRGSATTYGKRYSFLNATGIIVGGEDNDALSNSVPGSVKVEVVPDQDDDPAPGDPLDGVRADIKLEISRFVALSSAEFDGAAYFTDEEKADFKAKIAAVNEGAKAEKDLAKGLAVKLSDMKTLNAAISDELEKRKGNTDLATEMKKALHGKIGEQKEIF